MSAKSTLLEKYKAVQEIGTTVELPYHVWTCLHDMGPRYISIIGDQVSLGGDYVSVEGARSAVQWYVEQLGGTVKWSKI